MHDWLWTGVKLFLHLFLAGRVFECHLLIIFACGRNRFLLSRPPKLLHIVMMKSSCFALFHSMNYIFACDLLLSDAVVATIKICSTWSPFFPSATWISGYLKFYWNISDYSIAWHVSLCYLLRIKHMPFY